jgi:hypothetical protein
VTSIGDKAFGNDTALTSLSLGTALNSIGSEAFRNCTSLTSVIIRNAILYIGDSAFRDCSSLKSVKIGYSIKNIGACAFAGNENLKTVYVYGKSAEFGSNAFDSGEGLLIYGYEDSTAKSYAEGNENKFSVIVQSSLNASDFYLEKTSYTWTGGYILPVVKNRKNLTEGIDYDVVYDYEKYAGTHKVSVYPCNSYKASNSQGYFDLKYSIAKGVQTIGNISNTKVAYGTKNVKIEAKLLAGDGTLTYKSSKKKVATINKKTGAVKIKGVGTTVITVTAGATKNCSAASKKIKLTVTKGTQTIKGVKDTYTKKKIWKSFTIKAKAKGAVSYKSMNGKIVRVNSSGKVTIKKKGTTYIKITAKATKYYKKATRKVKIVIK